jgi:hypothetical protein
MSDFDHLASTEKKTRAEKAEEFLLEYLALGPQPANKLLADAKAVGISRSVLYEAKVLCDARELDAVICSERRHDGWWWVLRKAPDFRRRSIEHYEESEKKTVKPLSI